MRGQHNGAEAASCPEALEMVVVRASTSSQRMHISVGKTRGVRVTTKPTTLCGEVWSGIHTGMHTIEIATTPLSRPVHRQFTAVPPDECV